MLIRENVVRPTDINGQEKAAHIWCTTVTPSVEVMTSCRQEGLRWSNMGTSQCPWAVVHSGLVRAAVTTFRLESGLLKLKALKKIYNI